MATWPYRARACLAISSLHYTILMRGNREMTSRQKTILLRTAHLILQRGLAACMLVRKIEDLAVDRRGVWRR